MSTTRRTFTLSILGIKPSLTFTAIFSKEALNQEQRQGLFVNGLIFTPLNLMQHGRQRETARKFLK